MWIVTVWQNEPKRAVRCWFREWAYTLGFATWCEEQGWNVKHHYEASGEPPNRTMEETKKAETLVMAYAAHVKLTAGFRLV